jgi:hypothetical protein
MSGIKKPLMADPDKCKKQIEDVGISEVFSLRYGAKPGHVYVAQSGDVVKIGMTERDPGVRIAQLNGTGVIEDWRLISHVYSLDAPMLEKVLHDFLSDSRIRPDREFFLIHDEDATDLVEWANNQQASEIFSSVTEGMTVDGGADANDHGVDITELRAVAWEMSGNENSIGHHHAPCEILDYAIDECRFHPAETAAWIESMLLKRRERFEKRTLSVVSEAAE